MTVLRQATALSPVRRLSMGLCVLGGAGTALAMAVVPQRAWANLLLVSFALVCLGLGSAFFIAVTTLSGGTWALPLRRVAVLLCRALIPGSVGMLLVIGLHPSLYGWTREGIHAGHGFKAFWLSYPFFLARACGYLLLWNVLTAGLVRLCRRDITDGSGGRLAHWSALFVVVFAATFWLASVDWIMSLEWEWMSTIFGVYNFAGLFVATLAAMIIAAIWLQRHGLMDGFAADHLHDLGKLLFAFTTFWMYIWFSQYMLIWYTNFPEEAAYFKLRLTGGWAALFLTNLLLNWVIPFLALLPRTAKRSPAVLLRVAGLVLVGRWLDCYLMIAPAMQPAPTFGVPEAAVILVLLGVVLLLVQWEYRGDASGPRPLAQNIERWNGGPPPEGAGWIRSMGAGAGPAGGPT